MASFDSRPFGRLLIGLAAGLLLVGASAVGFWAGMAAPTFGGGPSRWLAGIDASSQENSTDSGRSPRDSRGAVADRPQDSEEFETASARVTEELDPLGHPPAAGSTGRARRARDGDASAEVAVLAALQRLERRMTVGMNRARDSVVALEYTTTDGPPGSRRLATGVVINSSGDILSVRIDPPSSTATTPAPIVARDASGRRHTAQWVAADPETGLTLLRIAPGAVKPIVIAPDAPALGSQVFVVGNPFGLGHTVSRGHVAGLDRALRLGRRQIGGLIQVQAPLYPGDSGAAVTDIRGQLLGLIRSGLANPSAPGDHADRENDFGFAIRTRDLLWVADHLRARGKVDRAYLGVRLQTATASEPLSGAAPNLATSAAASEGARLEEVISGTPAAKAGLQSGDAIIAIDGEPIHSSPDLTDRLDRLPSQTNIQLEVLRGRGPSRQLLRFALRTSSRPELEQHAPAATPRAAPPVATASNSTPQEAASPSAVPQPAEPASPPVHIRAVGSVTVTPTVAQDDQPTTTVSPEPSSPGAASDPATAEETPRASGRPAEDAPSASILPPARAPLPPPQAEDLKLTIPQVVTDRLHQFERRLETLERQLMKDAGREPAASKKP